jgi:hypothetical protein
MTCDQLSGVIEERSKIDRLKGEGGGKKFGATLGQIACTWHCWLRTHRPLGGSTGHPFLIVSSATMAAAVPTCLRAQQVEASWSNLWVGLVTAGLRVARPRAA